MTLCEVVTTSARMLAAVLPVSTAIHLVNVMLYTAPLGRRSREALFEAIKSATGMERFVPSLERVPFRAVLLLS